MADVESGLKVKIDVDAGNSEQAVEGVAKSISSKLVGAIREGISAKKADAGATSAYVEATKQAYGAVGQLSGAMTSQLNRALRVNATAMQAQAKISMASSREAAAALDLEIKEARLAGAQYDTLRKQYAAAAAESRAKNAALKAQVVAHKDDISAVKQSNAAHGGMIGTMQRLRSGVTSLTFALRLLVSSFLVREIIKAGVEYNRIINTLAAGLGSMQKARSEWEFLRKTANQMGLDLFAVSSEYAKFTAAVKGTTLQGESARKVFVGVAEAALVLGLSADRTERTFLALSQMASQTYVTAENLRQQFAEHIPGAMIIAAKAMGMTNDEFYTALYRGRVLATDLLPKLAAELDKIYGPQVQRASQTMIGYMNRLSTAWEMFTTGAAEGEVGGAIKSIMADVTDLLNTLSKDKTLFAEFAAIAKELTSVLKTLAENSGMLAEALRMLVAIKVASFITSMATAAGTALNAIGTGAGGGLLLALKLLATGVIWLTLKLKAWSAEMQVAIDKMVEMQRKAGDAYQVVHRIQAEMKANEWDPEHAVPILITASDKASVESQIALMKKEKDAAYDAMSAQQKIVDKYYANRDVGAIKPFYDAQKKELDRLTFHWQDLLNQIAHYEDALKHATVLPEEVVTPDTAKEKYTDEQKKNLDAARDALVAYGDAISKGLSDTAEASANQQRIADATEYAAQWEAEKIRYQKLSYEQIEKMLGKEALRIDFAADLKYKTEWITKDFEEQKKALEGINDVEKQRAKNQQHIQEAILDSRAKLDEAIGGVSQASESPMAAAERRAEEARRNFINSFESATLEEIDSIARGAADVFNNTFYAELLKESKQRISGARTIAELKDAYTGIEEAKKAILASDMTAEQKQRAINALTEEYRVKMLALVEIHENKITKAWNEWLQAAQILVTVLDRTDTKLAKILTSVIGVVAAWRGLTGSVNAANTIKNDKSATKVDMAGGYAGIALSGMAVGSQVYGLGSQIGLFRPGGGTSTFGGAKSGNYSELGSAIGSAIGAVIGAIAGVGVLSAPGAMIGAVIGSLIGGVVGSMVKKGADEALSKISSGNGEFNVQNFGDTGTMKDVANTFSQGFINQMNDILGKLGGSMGSMPLVDMKVRDDVVRVIVGGVVAKFKSMDDAIKWAIMEVLKQADIVGIDPMIKAALKNSKATTPDEISKDIEDTQKVLKYAIGETAYALRAGADEFDRLRGRMVELLQGSEQLGIALNALTEAELQMWQKSRDAITGHKQTPKEQLAEAQQNARIWNAEKAMRMADLKVKILDLKTKIQLAKAELDTTKAYLEGRVAFAKAENELDQNMLNNNKAYIEALEAQAKAYGVLLDELGKIPDIQMNEIHIASNNFNSGASNFQNAVKDFKDAQKELAKTIHDLKLGEPTTALTDRARLEIAFSDWQKNLSLARGGNLGAAQALPDLLNNVLTLAKAYTGGGALGMFGFDSFTSFFDAIMRDAQKFADMKPPGKIYQGNAVYDKRLSEINESHLHETTRFRQQSQHQSQEIIDATRENVKATKQVAKSVDKLTTKVWTAA